MGALGRLSTNSSIASPTFLQRLAAVLPKDINFKIYHISTPPSRTTALYPAPPGDRPDRTFCESHFLTASIEVPSKSDALRTIEVLVFAIEILIYSTAYSTTFFVSKADSTGYLHLLNLPKGTVSPLRVISATFLEYLGESRQRNNIQSVISLFARAQDQYLFPGSVEYSGKHVLDDRGLVKWWCRVLNPLIEGTRITQHAKQSPWENVGGYLIIPGLDTYETKSYVPRGTKATWTMGHPLSENSRHGSTVPPRCLIPHFPDDPKSRYLDELDEEINKRRDNGSGHWKSVSSVEQFWDMMAFRQECSAGRLVGFIWIVFRPVATTKTLEFEKGYRQSTETTILSQTWNDDDTLPPLPKLALNSASSFQALSQLPIHRCPAKHAELDKSLSSSQPSSRSTKTSTVSKDRKKKLTGPITPRQPRIKTENKSYLLERPVSSPYYEWREQGRGQVIVEESDYKRVTELILRLDFANLDIASSSSQRWTNEVRSAAPAVMKQSWGRVVTGTLVLESEEKASAARVNTLNLGLVRKRRKADDAAGQTPPVIAGKASAGSPAVNDISAGLIRKKPKV
ncbi:histone acetylation protein-domain-containing protein [Calycina marina]|uniref:histone acetyltransferase n=1 Tax=Calycina marina TaxID=1763456 RepID=A0A9P7Z0N7_9HELO|nr:histone acetylation protein-domain-containing protein [Calycina marina]